MRLILFIASLLIAQVASAQLSTSSKKAEKFYEESTYLIKRKQFPEAIEVLKKAIAKDEEFVEAHLRIASCYKKLYYYPEATDHYARAIAYGGEKAPAIARFYLGELYLLQGRYGEAIESLEEFRSRYEKEDSHYDDGGRLLESARFAKANMKDSVAFSPQPLAAPLNQFGLQYFPVLTADENMLIFTRRESTGYQYDEDIYYSLKDSEGAWSEPRSISPQINTQFNEGTCAISADGRTLIFTSCDGRRILGSCDLFVSYREGNNWSEPKNMGPAINSRAWESQPSLSADGRTLYFVSDRYGGKGRRDIWVSYLQDNGEWTDAVNLEQLNTEEDEVSPFMHVNGRTLYFASKGYKGFGGFDLFYSEITNGEWSEPVNLGYPVNTHEDQVSLYITPDGRKGYYALDEKRGGLLLSSKLYEFDVPDEIRVADKSAYVAGKIYDEETTAPLKAKVELFDLAADTLISTVSSDSVTGRYMMVLTEGSQYALYVNRQGYLFESQAFNYTDTVEMRPLHRDIPLKPARTGAATTLSNIFFEHDSYELHGRSITELNKVARFLRQNPGLQVEIAGHTDNTGSPEYNMGLSGKRARSVYDFMIEAGVDPERLQYKGYGQTRPKVANTSENNKSLNRRIEFRIL